MIKKAITAIILTILSGAFTASANEITDTLFEYSIMTGDENGALRTDEYVTRGEMARMVVSLLGEGDTKNSETSFSDVPYEHWASGYINKAYDKGIIAGMGDGSFMPDGKVTYEQAVKMIVCALGYEPMTLMRGGYPLGYMFVAGQKGIVEGLDIKGSSNAKRGDIAKMLYNSLDVPMLVIKTYDDGIERDGVEYVMMDGKNGIELITPRTILKK